MRSRWGVVAAVFAGLAACLALAFVVLGVTAAITYGRFANQATFLLVGFLIFSLLAVPLGVLLWRGGRGYRRAFAVGLLIAWAGSGAWVGWMATAEYLSSHGPATVAAFDALTGRRVWTAEFEDANGVSTPATGGGLVFVQTGRSYESTAGTLVALDAGTGRRLWEVATDGGNCGGAGVGAEPPVVADGVVVVRAADGHIKGIDARGGSERWRVRMAGAPAAAAGGVVVIGTKTIYTGLDVTSGRQQWTRTIPDAAWGDARPGERALVMGAGSVFIVELTGGEGFSVAALDAGNGQELWRASVGSVDSTVQRYVADGGQTLAALEGGPAGGQLRLTGRLARTGKRLWTTENMALGEAGLPQTAVAAHGGRVFYASAVGRLVAIDARSAAERWTATFSHQDALFPPRLTADEDAIAVRHVDRLFVFDPTTGVARWTNNLASGADPEAAPAVGEHLVMVPRSSTPCMPPTSSGMGKKGRRILHGRRPPGPLGEARPVPCQNSVHGRDLGVRSPAT